MSKQKGRRVPPPNPDAIRHGQVTNQLPTEESWNAAEQHRTLDAHVVAAGTVQHRVSGHWHTWMSLYGTDLTSWYVGPDGATAAGILAAIQKLFAEWTYTEDDLASMDALLAVATEKSSDPKATLPDDQVREALAEVAARQLRKN